MPTPRNAMTRRPLPTPPSLVLRLALAAAAAAAATLPTPAHAERVDSTLSDLSAVPLALSIAVPVSVLAAGATFVVVAVSATADGVAYVLERVADGLRFSLVVTGAVLEGASTLAGQAVTVTAVSAGWLLGCGSRVIAFVPNDDGRALLHHQALAR